MLFQSGYLTLGRIQRTAVRVHWTTPIGAYVLTGLGYMPGAWLGFMILILAHEVGHALLVRAFRHRVFSIDIHGLGGQCQWSGNATERERSIIAWGGVLAQIVLLLTTPLWATHLSPETTPFVAQMVSAFTATNVMVIILNLLPVRPLDGAEAWRLFRLSALIAAARRWVLRARGRRIQRKLDDLGRKPGEKGAKVIPFRKPASDKSMLH